MYLLSHVFILLLLPTDKSQCADFLGTGHGLQGSFPRDSRAMPSAPSVCNFSTIYNPPLSSARLLSSAPNDSLQLGHCLQSHIGVSYTGNTALAPKPELVMVLKEIRHADVPTPVCTSTSYHQMPTEHSKPLGT